MKKVWIFMIIIIFCLTGCTNQKTIIEEEKEPEEIKVESKKETEEIVTTYYEEMVNDMKSETTNEEKLWQTFFTVTDFLFYGSEIKGVTLKDLSDEAKLKLLTMYENLDSMLEEKYPNYQDKMKEKFGDTWESVKEEAKKDKVTLEEATKDALGEEKYQDYQTKIQETLDKWNNTYEKFKEEHEEEIKEKVEDAVEDIKSAGTKVKEELNEWYQNLKKKHNL